jgi:hypothetical protein
LLGLKAIIDERLQRKNMELPNLCSCGGVLSKLKTLRFVEDKTSCQLMELNSGCANNCIYYKNDNLFQRALPQLLQAITLLE